MLALALLAIIAIEALAQDLSQFGGDAYAMGYYKGSQDGMGNHPQWRFAHPHGYNVAPGGLSARQQTAYKAGYDAGWQATNGNGTGGIGMGGFGMGGFGTMNPVAAAGQYNLDTSKAAVNYQQAYQESIQNQKLRTQTYFDNRQMNASYRVQQQMQHQHASPEELAAFSRARLPAQLTADEFDPARGVIQWPGALNGPEFDECRTQLAELFRQATADPHGSGPGTRNYRDVQHAIDEISEKLHSEIAQFKPAEYIAASKFLKSLAHRASMLGPQMLAKQ